AAAGAMANDAEVAPASPEVDPASVYMPTRVRDRSPKVATPPLAGTVVVPPRVPPAGPLARPSVTGALLCVARLSNRSRISTVAAGFSGVPATASVGCTPKAGWSGAAGVMSKAMEVAPLTPAALAVSV